MRVVKLECHKRISEIAQTLLSDTVFLTFINIAIAPQIQIFKKKKSVLSKLQQTSFLNIACVSRPVMEVKIVARQ